jgi:Ser/Thr protein kinase RdoA (MazF antagonist)
MDDHRAVLLSCLSRYWGLRNVRATVHDGGMGSQTWFVDLGDRRWIAKPVAPGDGSQFAGGVAIAARLDQAGIPAGAPVPTVGGQLAVDVGDAWLAVLTWVPGHALTGQDDADQDLIGRTLAEVHRALSDYQVPQA